MSVINTDPSTIEQSLKDNQIPERPAGDTIHVLKEGEEAQPPARKVDRRRNPKQTKRHKSKNPEQQELVKVKLDATGKAAERFKNSLEALVDAQEEKGESMILLYKALVKSKRTTFQIHGYTFTRQHTGPKDTIKVQKSK